MGNNNSVKRIAAALGEVCFFCFFCASGIVAKCPISLKMTPLIGRGCTSPSFSVQICRAYLAIGIEYDQLLVTYTEVIN